MGIKSKILCLFLGLILGMISFLLIAKNNEDFRTITKINASDKTIISEQSKETVDLQEELEKSNNKIEDLQEQLEITDNKIEDLQKLLENSYRIITFSHQEICIQFSYVEGYNSFSPVICFNTNIINYKQYNITKLELIGLAKNHSKISFRESSEILIYDYDNNYVGSTRNDYQIICSTWEYGSCKYEFNLKLVDKDGNNVEIETLDSDALYSLYYQTSDYELYQENSKQLRIFNLTLKIEKQ